MWRTRTRVALLGGAADAALLPGIFPGCACKCLQIHQRRGGLCAAFVADCLPSDRFWGAQQRIVLLRWQATSVRELAHQSIAAQRVDGTGALVPVHCVLTEGEQFLLGRGCRMPLAEAEVNDQLKAARKEWQETVEDAKVTDSTTRLPAGVSRHDFTKWKEQQAVAARRRLAQLEERLQRLQLLRNKLSQMKANASFGTSNATMMQSVKFNLPGETDQTQPLPALLGTVNASGGAQWSTLEDVGGNPDSPVRNDGGGVSNESFRARLPANLVGPPAQIPPPFTPGFSGLRQIIRDEVSEAVKEGLGRSKVVEWDVDEEETCLNGGKTGVHAPSPPQAGDRPRTTTAKPAWTSQTNDSEIPPWDEDSGSPKGNRNPTKGVVLPLRIEDAELRSVPLLLGGLSRHSHLRKKCFAMMHSKAWSSFFFLSTLLSCVSSAFVVELGLVQDPTFQNLEYTFTGIFLIEIVIGVLALGFINGPTSWMRISGMNVSAYRACARACAMRRLDYF